MVVSCVSCMHICVACCLKLHRTLHNDFCAALRSTVRAVRTDRRKPSLDCPRCANRSAEPFTQLS